MFLLILQCLPSPFDCHGQPDAVVSCLYLVYTVTLLGWIQTPEGWWNPIYAYDFRERPTINLTLDIPDPPPGGLVTWWDEPVAVDAAGNRSDEGCP